MRRTTSFDVLFTTYHPAQGGMSSAPGRILRSLAWLLTRTPAVVTVACVTWYLLEPESALAAAVQHYLHACWVNLAFLLYFNPYTHDLYVLLMTLLS